MTSDEYKKAFEPIIVDLNKLRADKRNTNTYYSGKYNSLKDLLPYIPCLMDDYNKKSITRREFYYYTNVILKYRTGNHYTDIEELLANAFDAQGWFYLVELQNMELHGKGGGLLRVDFAIMDPNDDTKIAAFVEADGPEHKTNEEVIENDEIKNNYFAKLNAKLLRFDSDKIKLSLDKCVEEVRPYVESPGKYANLMWMGENFLKPQ